ncbi:hypothetical protein BN2127_JRS1_05187 [Bacillus cereus]|nr:hypothetical protein BN2127_JRS1_05187 [Bacillus cereus]
MLFKMKIKRSIYACPLCKIHTEKEADCYTILLGHKQKIAEFAEQNRLHNEIVTEVGLIQVKMTESSKKQLSKSDLKN